jgi:hypothetical protein
MKEVPIFLRDVENISLLHGIKNQKETPDNYIQVCFICISLNIRHIEKSFNWNL